MLGRSDFEQQLIDLKAEADLMIEKGERLAEESTKINISRTSSDSAVTIDLKNDGSLDKVQLGHRACELGHTKLTALINETFAAARLAYARKFESLVNETIGFDKPETRGFLLSGVSQVLADAEAATAIPSGRWAPVEPEPEPEAVKPKPKPAAQKPGPRRPADDNDYGDDRPW